MTTMVYYFRLSKSRPHSYLRYLRYSDLVSPNKERNVELDSRRMTAEEIKANPKSVDVRKAYELFKDGYRFLDVRTRDEFVAGHPSGALNIAYMFRVGEEMLKNQEFMMEVSSKFEKHEKILVGCKSGRRSLLAAKELQSFGFTGVIDVIGGYTAWKESGLPTTN